MSRNEKQQASHHPVKVGDAINLSLELAEREQNSALGIPSGFPCLDRLTRGWKAGELVVLGGRPCSGKTAIALRMARNAAVDFGVPTVYLSHGLTVTEITDRLIVSESGIPMEKLRGEKKMQAEDWHQMESSLKRLSDAPLYLEDTPVGMSGEYRLGEFKAIADELIHGHGVRLVFVDDLQTTIPDWVGFDGDCFARENRKNLHFLKEMAKDYDVTIVVLTNVERPKMRKYSGPGMMDLESYCPCAEDYADKIILLHRPRLIGFNNDGGKEVAEPLSVALVKNKNGRTGILELPFDSNRILVMNPDEKWSNV